MHTTRNRFAAFLAATLLLGALTACSNGTAPKADPTPTATGSTTGTDDPTGTHDPTDEPTEPLPTVTTDPDTGKFDYCKNQKPFTGAAADKFGAKDVANAYCLAVTLEMEQSFIDNVLRQNGEDLDPHTFDVWKQHMTKNAQDAVDGLLAKARKGDESVYNDLWPLMYFNVEEGGGYHFIDEPAALNQSFSPAETFIDTRSGAPRLALKFDVNVDFNMVKDGTDKHFLFPIGKTVSLYFVKSPTAKGPTDPNEWYVDAWHADYQIGKPYPRPKNLSGKASSSPTT